MSIPYEFEKAVETIRAARFDVLYHWETGTDVTNYFLPFCNLAPLQCTSGGNAETSGIAQIDYFLSSDLQETEDADSHYTETLLRIPGLPSFQKRVSLPPSPKGRDDFGYSSDQNLYVCAQKVQKIHPDFDLLLGEILRRDPSGVLVLMEDESESSAAKLRERFATSMSDVVERVVFESRLEFADYLCLLSCADVLLDPLHYGGGMTMYDALSLDKPVVTLPMRFVRSRYALGFYRRMGVSTPVASSSDEYVELAVRLGTDPDERRIVEAEIRDASPQIFEDDKIVRAYETIFQRLVEEARAR